MKTTAVNHRFGAPSVSTLTVPPGLVQRACACGGHSGADSVCESCRRQRLAGDVESRIQAKLTVNQPGDPFEREADRMADRVLQRQESPEEDEEELQAKPLAVQRQAQEEEEEELQTKRSPGAVPSVTPALESGIGSLRRGGGQSLSSDLRGHLEPRFGHSFANVRVHTGGEAARLARGLEARAFTVGKDVVFGAGQYTPQSREGLRLLAHELTHTVQQGAVKRRRRGSVDQ